MLLALAAPLTAVFTALFAAPLAALFATPLAATFVAPLSALRIPGGLPWISGP